MDKIREELKRYNMLIDQDGISVEELWCEHGDYVKYPEVKNIIKSRDKEVKGCFGTNNRKIKFPSYGYDSQRSLKGW